MSVQRLAKGVLDRVVTAVALVLLAPLFAGLALWIGYGILKGDFVIIVANAVGFALVATLIGFKIRDAR